MRLIALAGLTLVLLTSGCSDSNPIADTDMNVKFYRVTSIDLWGDYGNILVNGMAGHLGEKDGHLQLERAGPFIPPITFPCMSDLVVTDELKRELDTSDLAHFEFKKVIKARIVDLPWESFDRKADEPPLLPETGEPEDYILGRAHSSTIADSMDEIWQVVLNDGATVDTDMERSGGDYDVRVYAATWNGDHLFYGKKPDAMYGRWVIVTERGKKWLEEHTGDWVRFEELPVK